MEKRYLLDTNIAIYFLQGRLTSKASEFLKPILKNKANLSVISKIELLSWDEDPDISNSFVDNSQIFAMEEVVVTYALTLEKNIALSFLTLLLQQQVLHMDLYWSQEMARTLGKFKN